MTPVRDVVSSEIADGDDCISGGDDLKAGSLCEKLGVACNAG